MTSPINKDLARLLEITRNHDKLKRQCEWKHLKNEDDSELRKQMVTEAKEQQDLIENLSAQLNSLVELTHVR